MSLDVLLGEVFSLSDANKKPGGSARRVWPLFVGLPLIVAVAVAAVLFSGGERSQPSGEEQPRQSAAEEEQPAKPGGEREEASQGGAGLGHPALGDADAPVVMIEYGDFQ
jgi:hypothetical protein